LRKIDYKALEEKVRKNEKQKLAVICYAQNNGNILFLHRKKEPFAGFLVPPGGHVEDGEHVEDAIRREFLEETGLELVNLKLKMVTSEEGPEHYNWVLFIFTGSTLSDDFVESEEGNLVWIKKEEVMQHNLSIIDKELFPYIMDGSDKIWFAKIKYNDEKSFEHLEINELNL